MKSTYVLKGDDIRRGKDRVRLQKEVPCEIADGTVCGRTHVPGVSCDHAWVTEYGEDDALGNSQPTGREICTQEDCGAIVTRDPRTGEVLDYDATAYVRKLEERDRLLEQQRMARSRKTAA